MPLLQYFGWVGSFLLAALFATNWCCSAPIARASLSDVPLDQKVHIRTDHKWPERVVLDTTGSTPAHDVKADGETDVAGSETAIPAERQPFERSPRWCARASLCPVGFTSCQEEADAFAHESGQFTAKLFHALPHQSPHYHRQQDEIHEDLRR